MTRSRVAGTITYVRRQRKQTYCFEGTQLHKVGTGPSTIVEFAGTLYTGELVAISPTRAILLVADHQPTHGVSRVAETIAVSA